MAENPAPAAQVGTPADRAAASQRLEALLAGGMSAPQARGLAAEPDQKVIAYFDANNVLRFEENPNYNDKAPKTTVYGSADTGYFTLDGQGNAQVVLNPNPDAIVDKAVARQMREAERNERQANADAGKGYVTASERARIEQEGLRLGQSQQTINENIRQFDISARQKDQQQATQDRQATADIAVKGAQVGQIGAQTGLIGAQTTQTGAQTAALTAKTPGEIEETAARTAQIKQQTTEAQRKAGLPTVTDLGAGPTYGVMGPTGQITEQVRQGYVPKTLGEIQARVGQLSAAYNAKKQELQAKIGANYSAEQADKELGAWYDQNVTPQQQALQAAQEEALYQRSKDEAAARVTAYNAAQAAGTGQTNAFNAMKTHALGPGAEGMINQSLNAINKAAGRPEKDYSALVTRGPNIMESSQAAVDKALAQLSPTAAQRTGQPQPNYQGMDIAGQLNALRYNPPAAGGPAPAPAPGPVPAPVAGGPPPTAPVAEDPWAAWRARQGLDAGDQMRQAEAMEAWRASQAPPPEEPAPVPVMPTYQPQRRPAPSPVQRAAPTPPIAAPGLGFDPSNIPVSPGAPGMGYDPSNIPVTPGSGVPGFGFDPTALGMGYPPPTPEMAVAGAPYAPTNYAFPGQDAIMAAARAAYQRVPRTNWRPGG